MKYVVFTTLAVAIFIAACGDSDPIKKKWMFSGIRFITESEGPLDSLTLMLKENMESSMEGSTFEFYGENQFRRTVGSQSDSGTFELNATHDTIVLRAVGKSESKEYIVYLLEENAFELASPKMEKVVVQFVPAKE